MSVATTHNPVELEPASQAIVEVTAKPPFLYELSPAEARAALDELQAAPIDKHHVAIEQGYATAQWIVREGAANQLDPNRIAVAGDSVGGNMTAAPALMAAERRDVRFAHQSGITRSPTPPSTPAPTSSSPTATSSPRR